MYVSILYVEIFYVYQFVLGNVYKLDVLISWGSLCWWLYGYTTIRPDPDVELGY